MDGQRLILKPFSRLQLVMHEQTTMDSSTFAFALITHIGIDRIRIFRTKTQFGIIMSPIFKQVANSSEVF